MDHFSKCDTYDGSFFAVDKECSDFGFKGCRHNVLKDMVNGKDDAVVDGFCRGSFVTEGKISSCLAACFRCG